ncbi:MAG: phytoene desaturase [Chitinophagaceae bacterium]|nr:phytoene desaturase [Chitinophagaceae bacterium]
MSKNIIIIGAGFAGLSAASFLAKAGYKVTVLEKHPIPGGRARKMEVDGFTFDMGPSWYWMPDVFERFFEQFGKKVSDYYQLTRLDPSYRVYWEDDAMDIPAEFAALQTLLESIETGAGNQLELFLQEAAYKYKVGINKLVFKPGQSLTEFIDLDLMKGIFKLDVFNSMKNHIQKYFHHPKIKQLMEFPVLFLGALPENTPALYSLMNYADIKLGTWYPEGGMYSIVNAMHSLAVELGVAFKFNHDVKTFEINENEITNVVCSNGEKFQADLVIGGADYHFIESKLVPEKYQSYNEKYWDSRVMAPSSLLYYVGLNKKLKNVLHHTLFFDVPFEAHAREIYGNPKWPEKPLFYVSAVSQTDLSSAPEGGENLFFLIPVAAGLHGDTEELRNHYFDIILKRFEERTGESVKDSIVYYKTFAHQDFIDDYNAFKGNAYGLANTLLQTAILKPAIRSKKLKNLFYTGQLTVPGPGVPPSLISGEVVAGEVDKHFKH